MSQSVIKVPKESLESFVERLKSLSNLAVETTKSNYELLRGRYETATIIVYTSGKVVLSNADILTPVVQTILPDILTEKEEAFDIIIGSDEAGKGEWLGPIVVAAVALTRQAMVQLRANGVMDSKELSVEKMRALAREINQLSINAKTVPISPKRFNELISTFKQESVRKNLNYLLAWAHKTAINSVITSEMVRRHRVMIAIDEFDRLRMEVEIKKIKEYPMLTIIQEPRAEEITSVAAAGILARITREDWLDRQMRRLGVDLRRLTQREVVRKPWLNEVAKITFLKDRGDVASKEIE
jgi:ribonuclease HIII